MSVSSTIVAKHKANVCIKQVSDRRREGGRGEGLGQEKYKVSLEHLTEP